MILPFLPLLTLAVSPVIVASNPAQIEIAVAAEQAQSPAYDQLIRLAESKRASGDLKAAMICVADAITLDDKRFEAHATGALMFLQQQAYDEARMWMSRAIERAPQDKQDALRIMRDKIPSPTTEERYQQRLGIAREAYSKNLFAKAGREFLEAWRLKPEDPSPGLSAAAAFLRIEDYVQAAGILREVRARVPPGARAAVEQELNNIKPKLDERRDQLVLSANKSYQSDDMESARALIDRGLGIDPDHVGLLYLSSQVDTALRQFPAAVASLRRCVELGMIDRALLLEGEWLIDLHGNDSYISMVTDLFGMSAANSVRTPSTTTFRAARAELAKKLVDAAAEERIARTRKEFVDFVKSNCIGSYRWHTYPCGEYHAKKPPYQCTVEISIDSAGKIRLSGVHKNGDADDWDGTRFEGEGSIDLATLEGRLKWKDRTESYHSNMKGKSHINEWSEQRDDALFIPTTDDHIHPWTSDCKLIIQLYRHARTSEWRRDEVLARKTVKHVVPFR